MTAPTSECIISSPNSAYTKLLRNFGYTPTLAEIIIIYGSVYPKKHLKNIWNMHDYFFAFCRF